MSTASQQTLEGLEMSSDTEKNQLQQKDIASVYVKQEMYTGAHTGHTLINKCRLCLDKGQILIDGRNAVSTAEAIRIIADVNVNENNNFPRHLCIKCLSFLNEAMHFRKKAQETDRQLKQLEFISPTNTNEQSYATNNLTTIKNDCEDTIDAFSNVIDQKGGNCSRDMKQASTTNTAQKRDTQAKPTLRDNSRANHVYCEICKKGLRRDYFKRHVALYHSGAVPPERVKKECEICKKMINETHYKWHMADKHKIGHSKYVCEQCGQQFRYQSGYNTHMLLHTNSFPFKCDLCQYRAPQSHLLKRHMQVHAKDNKYLCTKCPARFSICSNFRRHMQTHSEGQYKCETCSKAFYSQLIMERHYEVDHLGIRNHECNICGKTFGYRSQMMKHQLKVHKRKKNQVGRKPLYLLAEEQKQHDNTTELPTEGEFNAP